VRHLLAAIALCAFVPISARSQPVQLPVAYDSARDQECALARGQPIKPEWEAELRARLPEFRRLWEFHAPQLSRAVTRLTGKPFTPSGVISLTLCDTPSNSFGGVTVNMRYALRAYVAAPAPLRYKVDTAFHEMLHSFVALQVPRNSTLLAAMPRESVCVRNHVHLLALQKAVLLDLGETEALAQVIAIDSQLPSGCYRRAWSHVNEHEHSYKGYVSELARGG
jgi:hypothetical protein